MSNEKPSSKPMAATATKPTTINAKNANQLDFEGSSNLKSATLDPATGIVTVEFRNGGVYRYGQFTLQKLGEWLTAPSAGKWFAANFKSTPEKPSAFPQLSATEVASADAPTAPATADASQVAGAPLAKGTPTKPVDLRTDYEKVSDEVRAMARRGYEGYAENSNGLTFDGRAMPAWNDLNHPVKSHWCAAAIEMTNPLRAQLEDLSATHATVTAKLSLQDTELQLAKSRVATHPDKVRADKLEAEIAQMKANPVIERAAMLEREVDDLRAKLALAEAEVRKHAAAVAATA